MIPMRGEIHQDFDLIALHAALEARRTALALSWADVGRALGVSAGTLRTLGTRPRAEGDGVLRMIAWLDDSPESFVPGRLHSAGAMPLPSPARALRFDARALYAALDVKRSACGLTWQQVAADAGVGGAGALTRLRAGGRVMFPEVMRVLAWLGAPVAQFVQVVATEPPPNKQLLQTPHTQEVGAHVLRHGRQS